MIIKKGNIINDINNLLNISIALLKTQEYNSKYEIRKNERKKYVKIISKMLVNKAMMIKKMNMKIINIMK